MGGCILCATNVPLKICLTVVTLQVSAEFASAQHGLGWTSPRVPLSKATASPVGYGVICKACIHVMFQCNFVCSVKFIQANKLSIKNNPVLFRAKISLCLLVFRKRNGFSNSVIVVCVVFLAWEIFFGWKIVLFLLLCKLHFPWQD